MPDKKEMAASPYRFCIWGIWIFLILSQYYLPFAMAPLLTTVMEEYALDYTAGGFLITVVAVIGGISMFAGSGVVRSMGLKRGALAAVIFFLVGDVISVFAPSYAVLIVGRICIGVGYGLTAALTGAMVMAWFPPKEQPFLNTINTVIGTLAQTAAYSVTLPLQNMLGGDWRQIFTWAAVALCIVLAAWGFLGRSAPAGNGGADKSCANMSTPEKTEKKTMSGGKLGDTWKRSEVKKLTVAAVGMFMAFTAVSTFFPSYLELARGFSAAQAAVMTGFMPMAGLIGSLLVGSLAGIVGLRRPFMWPLMLLAVAGMAAASLSEHTVLITAGLCAVGFGVSAYIPMIYTYLMDLPGATPDMVASGVALTIGAANIATLLDSFIYNALAEVMGLSTAFIPFGVLLAVSLLVSLTLPETGPGRKK